MKWYTDILYKMLDDYFSTSREDQSHVKNNIDQTVSTLEKIFTSDGEIPLEILIGLIHSTFNLLTTTDTLTPGNISQKVLGYAIIYAKIACEEAIRTIDFANYHPIKNSHALCKYERKALIQLDFATNINLAVIQKFENILNKYATRQDRLQIIKTMATFDNKELLSDLYKNLTRYHPLAFRLLKQENQINDHIRNGTGEANGLTIRP